MIIAEILVNLGADITITGVDAVWWNYNQRMNELKLKNNLWLKFIT